MKHYFLRMDRLALLCRLERAIEKSAWIAERLYLYGLRRFLMRRYDSLGKPINDEARRMLHYQ